MHIYVTELVKGNILVEVLRNTELHEYVIEIPRSLQWTHGHTTSSLIHFTRTIWE